MPCDNCGHTLHNLGLAGQGRTFWCQRCGSLKVENGGFIKTDAPRWTQKDDSVPVCQRHLAMLGELVNSAFAIVAAKEHLRHYVGDVIEAMEKVKSNGG